MYPTNNLHVLETETLLTPDSIKAELAITEQAAQTVHDGREAIRAVLSGADARCLAIVGPCSIHDPDAALDYARWLCTMNARFSQELVLVMRVYFEKPRTSVGWKGLINDPELNGTCDIPRGLRLARRILLDITHQGLLTAHEMLDPIVPQYIADLVCWAAIGARTTESQTHREMASGLSMPVGFKNATDGSIDVAVNALISAARSHRFLGIDGEGRVSLIRTSGNPDGHLVLRGGHTGPNHQPAAVEQAARRLTQVKAHPAILIDCSHDNSGKDYRRQPEVLDCVARQIAQGSRAIVGVMIESNLVQGRQEPEPASGTLCYGQSITDACVDLGTTQNMLEQLAEAVRCRGRMVA